MKKTKIFKITLSLASLLLAMPVFAEVNPSKSNVVDGQYVPDVNLLDLERIVETPRERAEREAKGEKLPAEVNPPVVEEVVQEPDVAAPEVKEEKPQLTEEQKILMPYIGKTIVEQKVQGNINISEEEVFALLHQKQGMQITEAGVNEDLRAIYESGWFYELRPVFKDVSDGVSITYEVHENPIYNGFQVTGNTILAEKKVNNMFKMEPGRVANLKEINKVVADLEEEYRSAGYILARVNDAHLDDEGILRVEVNEGVVEDYKVKGNVKCKDNVILREITIKKGHPFNSKSARRSMQRVQNLGFFEDVNIKMNPGQAPGAVEVEIDVKEMNTGQFGIGAGYSNADGFVGQVSIGDRNFLGSGDSFNIRWEFGGVDNKNYDFTYSKPWIDKHETRMTLNLYDITNEYEDYDIHADSIARYEKKRRGQELTLSRRAESEFLSNYITLKNRDDIYNGVADGYGSDFQYYEEYYNRPYGDKKIKDYYPKTAKERREENFGKTHSITFGRVFDNRDNIYDPHEGKRLAFSIENSQGLGGDFGFVKYTVDTRYYFRAGGESVWALNIMGGYASGDMPLSQRFSMGGSETLRGYEDDQYRGNSMVKGTLEYRFPIIKKIQGVLFNDNGYAWDKRFEDKFDFDKTKSSVGVGLRINSPLGPIRLDYGWGSKGGKFHFSFGGQF